MTTEAPAKKSIRPWIYNRIFSPLASGWYRVVLERLPAESYLLDVGIGTGQSLIANAALAREKRLRILGLDIDDEYLVRCRKALDEAGLAAQVEVRNESIYDHVGGPYDAVYFSSSFPVLPDPDAALRQIRGQLAPEGRVYFTQTFHHRRSFITERVKPRLHKVTTVDFGRVTYEEDFRRHLEEAGLELEELTPLGKFWNASYRLGIARLAADPSSSA